MLKRNLFILSVFLLPIKLLASPTIPFGVQVITQVMGLHFGGITTQANSSCNIDSSGNISGQCNTTDANISVGQLIISDLSGNTDFEVMISGSSNSELLFIATADITGGKGGKITTTDGQIFIITTKGNGADLTIDVYGEITLQTDITTSQDYTVDYNIQINAL